MPDFSQRSYDREWMDDLQASGEVIVQSLRELETINRLLGGNNVSISGLKKILRDYDPSMGTILLADVGCGGGDILKLLAEWARSHKLAMRFVGIDANPHVLDYARVNTAAYPEVSYQLVDIFSEAFSELKFDIIHSSLFTHHFTDEELIYLYTQWGEQARMGIINNDLHRHWFAFHSIDWLTRWFSKSPMVKNDARLSVLRSFSKRDWEKIMSLAGLHNYEIRWRWAFRWELVIYC